MLGRFSSVEVCSLNPREEEKGVRKQESDAEKPTNRKSEEERMVARGVFRRIRVFLSVSQALCLSLLVIDGPPL